MKRRYRADYACNLGRLRLRLERESISLVFIFPLNMAPNLARNVSLDEAIRMSAAIYIRSVLVAETAAIFDSFWLRFRT